MVIKQLQLLQFKASSVTNASTDTTSQPRPVAQVKSVIPSKLQSKFGCGVMDQRDALFNSCEPYRGLFLLTIFNQAKTRSDYVSALKAPRRRWLASEGFPY